VPRASNTAMMPSDLAVLQHTSQGRLKVGFALSMALHGCTGYSLEGRQKKVGDAS